MCTQCVHASGRCADAQERAEWTDICYATAVYNDLVTIGARSVQQAASGFLITLKDGTTKTIGSGTHAHNMAIDALRAIAERPQPAWPARARRRWKPFTNDQQSDEQGAVSLEFYSAVKFDKSPANRSHKPNGIVARLLRDVRSSEDITFVEIVSSGAVRGIVDIVHTTDANGNVLSADFVYENAVADRRNSYALFDILVQRYALSYHETKWSAAHELLELAHNYVPAFRPDFADTISGEVEHTCPECGCAGESLSHLGEDMLSCTSCGAIWLKGFNDVVAHEEDGYAAAVMGAAFDPNELENATDIDEGTLEQARAVKNIATALSRDILTCEPIESA